MAPQGSTSHICQLPAAVFAAAGAVRVTAPVQAAGQVA